MEIRRESAGDAPAIRALVGAAFADAPHAGGNEAGIVDALRDAGALALSLVACEAGRIVGHIAFSPVTVEGAFDDWFGLGPLAVEKGMRQRGIGHDLVEAGLVRLRRGGAEGCVVLGDPGYYGRFGFVCDPRLVLEGVPAAYFQRLAFCEAVPFGLVRYHEAFAAAG